MSVSVKFSYEFIISIVYKSLSFTFIIQRPWWCQAKSTMPMGYKKWMRVNYNLRFYIHYLSCRPFSSFIFSSHSQFSLYFSVKTDGRGSGHKTNSRESALGYVCTVVVFAITTTPSALLALPRCFLFSSSGYSEKYTWHAMCTHVESSPLLHHHQSGMLTQSHTKNRVFIFMQ